MILLEGDFGSMSRFRSVSLGDLALAKEGMGGGVGSTLGLDGIQAGIGGIVELLFKRH